MIGKVVIAVITYIEVDMTIVDFMKKYTRGILMRSSSRGDKYESDIDLLHQWILEDIEDIEDMNEPVIQGVDEVGSDKTGSMKETEEQGVDESDSEDLDAEDDEDDEDYVDSEDNADTDYGMDSEDSVDIEDFSDDEDLENEDDSEEEEDFEDSEDDEDFENDEEDLEDSEDLENEDDSEEEEDFEDFENDEEDLEDSEDLENEDDSEELEDSEDDFTNDATTSSNQSQIGDEHEHKTSTETNVQISSGNGTSDNDSTLPVKNGVSDSTHSQKVETEDRGSDITATNEQEQVPSPIINSGVIFEKNMPLIEFLRRNRSMRNIDDVLKYYTLKDIDALVKKGRIIKRKGKLYI